MDLSHSHGKTTYAYEGVNGVNLSFVAESLCRFLDQTLSASSSIDVLFRRIESTPFCITNRVFNRLDSAHDALDIPSRSHKITS